MHRILILSPSDTGNRAFAAFTLGTIKSIRAYVPEVSISLLSDNPSKDGIFEKYGVTIRKNPWARRRRGRLSTLNSYVALAPLEFYRCLLYRFAHIFNRAIKDPYEQYDVVVNMQCIDIFDERVYGHLLAISGLIQMIITRVITGRPMITIPATIAPFTNKFSQFLAKKVFDSLSIVAVRDEMSYNYLQSLHLSKAQICLIPDMAFLFDPASRQRIKQILEVEGLNRGNKRIIGISPNEQQMKLWAFGDSAITEREREAKYVKFIAAIADYLVKKLDATVCLIPHVIATDYGDDLETCRKIFQSARHKQSVKLLMNEAYSADEIKGIIGNCDLFIGCRMHASIAALSMGVPTLTVGSRTKFYGVVGKMMDQEDYIVNITEPALDRLIWSAKSKIDSLWINKDKIERELKEKVRGVQDCALFYGNLINELVESSKLSS